MEMDAWFKVKGRNVFNKVVDNCYQLNYNNIVSIETINNGCICCLIYTEMLRGAFCMYILFRAKQLGGGNKDFR